MNKELEGWGIEFYVGQVRMDIEGNLAVIISFAMDGLMLQMGDYRYQHVPMHDTLEFQETTFGLGDL